MKKSMPDLENARALLEQHWLHCRHLESERAWFMSVYAAIAGGMLAFWAQQGLEFEWPLYFLIGLTFFGFFHTIRWTYALECHRKRVNSFARIINPDSSIDPTMDIPEMEFGKAKGAFRTKYWFPLFYFSTLVLFAILFPFPPKWLAIGCLAAASLIGAGFLRSKPK